MFRRFLPLLMVLYVLPVLAAAEDQYFMATMQLYQGTYQKPGNSQVIIASPDNRPFPAPGLKFAEELQQFYQLDELKLVSEPTIIGLVNRNVAIEQGIGPTSDGDAFRVSINFLIEQMDGQLAHTQITLTINGKGTSTTESLMRLGEPLTIGFKTGPLYLNFLVCMVYKRAPETADPKSRPSSQSIPQIIKGELVPEYPPALKARKVEGDIRMEFDLDAKGIPGNFKILSSDHPELVQAAMDAVKGCYWDKATIWDANSLPASAAKPRVALTIRFRL